MIKDLKNITFLDLSFNNFNIYNDLSNLQIENLKVLKLNSNLNIII